MTAVLYLVGVWLAVSATTAGAYTLTRRIHDWRYRP